LIDVSDYLYADLSLNGNINCLFIFTVEDPQLIYNKLPRRTAQIQSNTKHQL